jgi:general secretion pathway protein L
MASVVDSSRPRFFGVDVRSLRDYIRAGLAEILQWKPFRWLTPQYPVRLIHADGTESVRLGTSSRVIDAPPPIQYEAIELPEEGLLRRSLNVPALAPEVLHAATAIDALNASPFAESDLVWTHAVRPLDRDRVRVDIALTSRRLVDERIAAHGARLRSLPPEVWVGGAHPIVVPGYGESRRIERGRRERNLRALLAGLIVVQLVACALFPVLRLRQLALDAVAREAVLAEAVKTQVRMRAELAQLSEQVRLLDAARGEPIDVVWLLDEITRRLPDDASLSRLEISGDSVRLVGQSDNAAQLIETLGANPRFRDVRAPGGITRARGSKESFTIEFSLAAARK